MNLESLDWEVLDRLRETFLTDAKSAGPYWHTITDLEAYNLTYGERIGWKWDAVLAELNQRGWAPPVDATLLDWGCGSGVAGRRVLDAFGPGKFARLLVHDHSELAMDFSVHHGRQRFPQLEVARADARQPDELIVSLDRDLVGDPLRRGPVAFRRGIGGFWAGHSRTTLTRARPRAGVDVRRSRRRAVDEA